MNKLSKLNSKKQFLFVAFLISILFSSCRIKDGPIETFYKNGNKKVEGYILNNKQNGLWKYYNENGIITDEINYKNGIKFGVCRHYFEGKLNDQDYYNKDGKKNGLSYNYFAESGQLHAIGKYSNDLLDSIHIYYYDNGKTELIHQYNKGKKCGNWIYFNRNGDTLRIEKYSNDSLEWVKVIRSQ